MSQVEENKVFMVLFNYNERDFSVVKIFSSLEKAYKYICLQQHSAFNKYKKMNMVEINDPKNLTYSSENDCMNICYVKTGKYLHLDIYDRSDTSEYIIVPMDVN